MALDAPQGWKLDAEGTRLERRFTFDTHLSAAQFVQEIAVLSEALDHHPEVTLSWRACHVVSWSHDSGGVTQRDVTLAERINQQWQTQEGTRG